MVGLLQGLFGYELHSALIFAERLCNPQKGPGILESAIGYAGARVGNFARIGFATVVPVLIAEPGEHTLSFVRIAEF
jgi:hypothetical protein